MRIPCNKIKLSHFSEKGNKHSVWNYFNNSNNQAYIHDVSYLKLIFRPLYIGSSPFSNFRFTLLSPSCFLGWLCDLATPNVILNDFLIESINLESSSLLYFSTRSTLLSRLCNKVFPAGIYLPKVNNRNTRTRCEICSLLLTLNIFHTLF